MSLKITQNFRTYCCFLLAFILSAFSYGNLNAQVFFSEYAEGSSNNKYLEIYNAGDEVVDLTEYAYPSVSNAPTVVGEHEYWNAFDDGAVVAPGDVYIIAHPSSDSAILAHADETHTYLSNGDDGYALVYGTEEAFEVVDWIGDWNGDPGSGWEVAGVSNGTKDHVLVRKCGITSGNTDWTLSAGTNAEDSEWTVLAMDTWDNLGSHQVDGCVSAVFGCTDEAACNFDAAATDDDLSCEYANVCGSCDGDLSCTVSVTVSVDMNNEGYDAANGPMTIRLDGGDWADMSDEDGDNVWTYTFNVLPNTDYVYNFYDTFYESGDNLADCAGGNYGNDRTFTATDVDLVVPTVCWESCTECVSSVPGCMDATACNYSADATEDDGSCSFAADGYDCAGNCTLETPSLDGEWLLYDSGWTLGTNWDEEQPYVVVFGDDGNYTITASWGWSQVQPYTFCGNDLWMEGGGWPDYEFTFADGSFSGCYDCGASAVPYTMETAAGCTDASACNYNEFATSDDGSCTFAVEGYDCDGNCLGGDLLVMSDTYGDGWNGNVLTINGVDYTIDNGYSSSVCVPTADCYTISWTNGSYIGETSWSFMGQDFEDGAAPEAMGAACVTACTDEAANNYNADADISDNTLCTYDLVQGCMDATACNYDAAAEQDNGSCTYAAEGFDCLGNCLSGENLTLTLYDSYNDGWDYWDGSVSSLTINGEVYGDDYMSGPPISYTICADLDACTEVVFTPANGWSSENSWDIADADGTVLVSGGNNSDYLGTCVTACMDEAACNYNADADIVDNTLCEYANSNADCDGNCLEGFTLVQGAGGGNGSGGGNGMGACVAIVEGCTDATASNYNADANTDNGSCDYSVTVTFSVNTSNITVGANGMYVGGGVLGMADAYAMSDDDGDGVWTVDIELPAGTSGNYVFFNSPGWAEDWGSKENLTDLSCGDPGNWWDRVLPTVNSDTTLLHCFGSCENDGTCPDIPGCTDATAFNYDANANVDDGSCEFLAEGESPYCDTQVTHFMIEAEVASAISLSIGNNGPNSIIVQIESADADPIDDLVINSSTGGYALGSMSSSDGVFSNTMTWDSDVSTVNINVLWSKASFGGNWMWSQTDMTINVNDTCDIVTSPAVSGCTDATATNFNAEATVDDGSCEYATVLTTFNVDMNCAGVEFSTVHITGPVWGWTADIMMSDDDGDGIYSITFDDLSGDVEYKYMVDAWAHQENLVDDMNDGGDCAPVTDYSGYANRQVSAGTTTNDTYGSCSACADDVVSGCTDSTATNFNAEATVDNGSCEYPAVLTTFNVDMNCAGVEFSTVHITGPGWGWTADIIMSDDDGDGIYSITFDDLSGDVEYKYMVDAWAHQEDLVDDMVAGGDCAPVTDYSGYANRQVPAGTTTNDTYGSCSGCADDVLGCTDSTAFNYNAQATVDDGSCDYCGTATVTFSVDAQNVMPSINYDNVVANGTFAGPWWGWGVTLADADGDGIYTGTAEVEAGVQHQYVFALTGAADGWSGWGQIGYADEECALGIDTATGDDAPNYYFTAQCGEELILPTVCFASCDECVSPVPGCMDSTACNYNADATEDDASCTYAAANEDCNGGCEEGYTSGPSIVTFTLENGADNSLPENRDVIIPGEVEITRGEYGPLFNAAVCDSPWESDCGILWKFGSIDHPTSSWATEFECEDNDLFDDGNGSVCDLWNIAGETYILHCLASDRYFEVLFNQWTNGGGQGDNEDTYLGEGPKGFSYTRTEIDSLGNEIDSDCVPIVEGCMDATACNYNADANTDDASCTFAAEGFDCDGNCSEGELLVMSDSYGDGWNDAALTINGVDYACINDGANGLNSSVCVPTADCYIISWTSGYYDSETSWSFMGQEGSGGSAPENMGACVTACTDSTAENYNADADISDNTLCEYALVQGCTDATACNFDAAAEQDNGSCEYPAEGFDCDGNCLDIATNYTLTLFDSYGDGWYASSGVHTVVVNGVSYGQDFSNGTSSNSGLNEVSYTLCLDSTICNEIGFVDGGSWESECSWNLADAAGNIIVSGNSSPEVSIFGSACVTACTDSTAENYNADADISDNTLCEYALVQGCTDEAACNFDAAAEEDNGSCTYAVEGFDCDGNCLEGVAVVYTPGSYSSENSFTIADCDGNVVAEMSSGAGFNGCVVLPDVYTVTLEDSYGDGWNQGSLTIGDDVYTILDVNGESTTNVWTTYPEGEYQFNSVGDCPVPGCMDSTACNYNADATEDDASCTFADAGYDCDGVCLVDTDGDGVCDEFEIAGCTDATACNFSADATDDDASCTFASEGFDCDGNCLEGELLVMSDSYGDGWNGNILTINGVDYTIDGGSSSTVCVPTADCYVMSWTNGSYTYETSWSFMGQEGSGGSAPENMGVCVTACTDSTAENYNADADISDNTLCEYAFVQGCMDETACNYDAAAEQDNGSCEYPAEGFDCDGNCLEGTLTTINVQEMSSSGWTYTLVGYGGSWSVTDLSTGASAGSTETDDFSECLVDGCYEVSGISGSGSFYGFAYDLNGAGLVMPGNTGETGSALFSIGEEGCITGCTDSTAENYDATAHISDNTLCEYALVQGCTDEAACNYDAAAEQDNGSCTYAEEGFDCDGNCLEGELFVLTLNDTYGDGWYANPGTHTVVLDGVAYGEDFSNGTFSNTGLLEAVYSICLDTTSCHEIAFVDGGSYETECSWNFADASGNVIAEGFSGFGSDLGDTPTIFGTCVTACTDSTAENYNADADISDNTLCEYALVQGCTDETACNFDAAAEEDNGSCEYPAEGLDCEGNCISGDSYTLYMYDSYGDGWGGNELYITDADGNVQTFTVFDSEGQISSSWTQWMTDSDGDFIEEADPVTFCLPEGCASLSWGENEAVTWNSYVGETSFMITNANGDTVAQAEDGIVDGLYIGDCPTGCTNPLANNYDPVNIVDDGSCLFCLDGEEVSELPEATLPDDVITITIQTGSSWSQEISWELYNNETEEFIISSTQTYANNQTYVKTTGCLPAACYKLVTYDSYGDGWNGNGTFTVTNQFGEVLVPSTVMGPNSGINTESELGDGYGVPQELSTYFGIGDASCATFGCTDPAASNYDADATVDDGSCITCPEGEVDVTFSFNQENITTDEVFVYNETDTVFSVVSGELGLWEGKTELMCVPAGCYTISMGATSNSGWTDGSQLQILDDLTADYYFLGVDEGSINLTVVSIGGGECEDPNIGGCTDEAYDNYNPDATFDNGSCEFLCTSATEGAVASVEEDADSAPWSFLCSDASGFGAVVTFEELNADMVYVVADCDSAEVFSFNPNLEEVTLEAGQCIYFQAVDAFNTDSIGTITATLTELPDSSTWGCMDEFACNYDELATYEPADACEYPEVGFDCDGVELADYMDVELDFTGSFNLCLDDDDYNATDIVDYPGFSWNTDGEDMAFAFVADGNQVLASVFGYSDGTFNDGHLVIYNGNPLDGGTLVDSETYSGSEDMEFDIIFDTDSLSTYFVIVDSDNFDDCYEFDISISSLVGEGGCTDEFACNYNDSADYNDLSCIYPVDGFDCDGNFTGSACGTENVITDSITVPYTNNMYEVFTYPSDGVTPVSILFTSGDTEGCCDDWRIYDGVGDDAISTDNLIAEFNDVLEGLYAQGNGNGITVVWDTDGSVNGDETYGNMVFNVYCADFNYGCMDTLALNYDSIANMEDGSCVYDFVFGCTDELACNYADTADVDDGSCTYAVTGFDCDGNCLDGNDGYVLTLFDTYGDGWYSGSGVTHTVVIDSVAYGADFSNGTASNSGLYEYVYNICLDSVTCHEIAFVDGGSYETECSWTFADASGNIIAGGSSGFGSDQGTSPVFFGDGCGAAGCMDELACNYDADATFDNGSCTYAQDGFDCDGLCITGETYTLNLFDSYGDGWDHGTGHVVVIDGVSYGGMDFVSGNDYSVGLCLDDICHEIYFIDNGPYENECSFEVIDADSNVVYASNFNTTIDNPGSFGDECGTFGCTDPSASNYDETVDFDNGSCTYPVAIEVELDYTTSSSTCAHENDYDGTNTDYEPGFSDYMDGEDMGYYFSGANGTVIASFDLVGNSTYTSMAIFDGNPLDSTTTLLEFEWSSSSSTGESIMFETNDSTTYYVVVDGYATWGCYDYDLSIVYTSGTFGCTDVAACNYDSLATSDDGSCIYPENEFVDCDGNCVFDEVTVTLEDSDIDGTLASISVNGQVLLTGEGSVLACVDLAQCNTVTYNSNDEYWTSEDSWSVSDSTAVYASVATDEYNDDLNEPDVQQFGGACALSGCMDSTACNYDPNAEVNFGCTYAEEGYDCDGLCLEDADGDGVCDADEVSGCTDPTATNYDPSATDDDNSCVACEENSIELLSYDAFGDSWNGATFSMTSGVTVITSGGVTDYTSFASEYLCVPDGCYEVVVGGGATDYEISFTLGDLIVNAQAGTFSDISVGDMDGVAYCDVVLGCTDSLALNYDDLANVDDGSCIAVVEGCTDELACNFNADANTDDNSCVFAGEGLDCDGVCLEDADGDGVCDADEVSGCTDETAINYDGSATDDDGNCCYADIDEDGICDDDEILGCTDANADNYDPNAGLDDGSCTFCGDFTAVILATSDASAYGASDGNVQATGSGGSSNYDVNVFDTDGVPQNPFGLSAGDYVVVVTDQTSGCLSELAFAISQPDGLSPCDIVPTGLSVDNIIHNRVTFNWSAADAAPSHYMIRYRVLGSDEWTVISAGPINTIAWNGTSRTRYFMEPGTTYEWSIRARVLNEDLTINCQSDWSANSEYTTLPECPNLDNLSVSTEATWVTFFADAPAEEWGVWQSKGKMRELGSNSYRYVIGGDDGNINGLKGNFTASTDYEWHTKAWCTGNVDEDGNSDPQYHSGWGDFSPFSTEAPCDAMPMNLTTSSNGANTAVTMSWDTPESGAPDHYFLEMTNVTTGAVYEWNNIPGTATSQTKFNQNPGDEISWRIRGACGTNGTSWATIFSQPVTYTLGGERVAAELVSGLDVYPNPSRDIFNVTFTSEEAQTMSVKVVNMIGEEIYNEELVEFVGQYTKVIDMNTQPKGVYFLEITTSTGGINKKIVLQ